MLASIVWHVVMCYAIYMLCNGEKRRAMSGPIASVPVSAPATETSDAVKVALSGKGMKDENFPVASFMLARRHRPVVVAYYRFARTADDVADSGVLPPDVKVAALDIMQAVLEGREDPALSPEAAALRRDLLERGIPLHLASDLLTAFRTDSRGLRCRTWDDLLAYCTYSANPVGRFLLRLHGARSRLTVPRTHCVRLSRSSTICKTCAKIGCAWAASICRWNGSRPLAGAPMILPGRRHRTCSDR